MRKKRIFFLVVVSLAVTALLVTARHVLLPFVLALLVAYVLTPVVTLLERRRLPRAGAILLSYVVTLGAFYGFFSAITPRIVAEATGLGREVPAFLVTARNVWTPRANALLQRFSAVTTPPPGEPTKDSPPPAALHVVAREDGSYDVRVDAGIEVHPLSHGVYRVGPKTLNEAPDADQLLNQAIAEGTTYVRHHAGALVGFGHLLVSSVSRFIFLFFLTLMLAAYLILTRERLVNFFRVLCLPADRPAFDALAARIDHGLAGVVRGQLAICLVNGLLSAIGFWLLGLHYWPILALLAAIMSIIPIFGAILSSIPAVAIGLTQSFGTGLGALLFILGIHQLEANVLNPKIIGDSAKIHPVLVVFSLLVGEHLFQLPGALLAVPCLSIAQSLFLHFRQLAYGDDAPPESMPPPRIFPRPTEDAIEQPR